MMFYYLSNMIILSLWILSVLVCGTILTDPDENIEEYPEENISRDQNSELIFEFSNLAYDWLKNQSCNSQTFTSERNCISMQQIPKNEFRIYAVEPNAAAAASDMSSRYGVLFPDGEAKDKSFHDGIVILDPFPTARFGHPILVFLVDILPQSKCNGLLTDNGIYCVQLALRNHCSNRVSGLLSKLISSLGSNCDITFLPLVFLETERGSGSSQLNDRLRCYPNLVGYKRNCSSLRAKSETAHPKCDRLLTNIDCFYPDNYFRTQCSVSQICDNAVLLSGGWNRQLSDKSSLSNIMNMKSMLMLHGFREKNIKIFFANGKGDDDPEAVEENGSSVYSATMKFTIRNHIRSVCNFDYCSDTLMIYLNSPAKPDGSSVLWDLNADGVFDETELYSPKELLRDINHCKANRVIVIADQSYAGQLVSAAEARFTGLQNVAIFTASEQFDWDFGQRDRLTKQLLRAKYTDICLNDFKEYARHANNPPIFIGSKMGLLNSTLVGGPCTEEPSYLKDTKSAIFRGCHSSPII